jgi:hypothetical protein
MIVFDRLYHAFAVVVTMCLSILVVPLLVLGALAGTVTVEGWEIKTCSKRSL